MRFVTWSLFANLFTNVMKTTCACFCTVDFEEEGSEDGEVSGVSSRPEASHELILLCVSSSVWIGLSSPQMVIF